jgi:hypothetical protein
MKVGEEIKRCRWYLFIYLSLSHFLLCAFFFSSPLYLFIHTSNPSFMHPFLFSHISNSQPHILILSSMYLSFHPYMHPLSSFFIFTQNHKAFLINVNKAHFHMSKEGKVHDMVILSEVTVILQSH